MQFTTLYFFPLLLLLVPLGKTVYLFPQGFLDVTSGHVNLNSPWTYPTKLLGSNESTSSSGAPFLVKSATNVDGPFRLRLHAISTVLVWFTHTHLIQSLLHHNGLGYREDVFYLFALVGRINKEEIIYELPSQVKFTVFNAFIAFYFEKSKELYFVCGFCPAENYWQFPLVNVPESKVFKLYIAWKKHEPNFSKIKAIMQPLYSHRYVCDQLICAPWDRLAFVARQKFNFTLDVVSLDSVGFWKLEKSLEDPSSPYSLVLGREPRLEQYRQLGPNYGPYIRDRETYYILYCENGWTTTNASYHHWISAFDWITWILILAGAVAAALLSSRLKPREIFPEILRSLCILIRSPVGNMGKLDNLMAMSFLCLSMCYESNLTGEITVPPPPIVARNLKELLVDKGFKIVVPVGSTSRQGGFDLHEFRNGFEKYNLTHIFQSKLQELGTPEFWRGEYLANRTNRLGTDVPHSDITWWLLMYGVEGFKNGRFCHIVKDPFFDRLYATRITGYGFRRLIGFLHLLREVGLEVMWQREYAWFYWDMRMRFFMRYKDAEKVLAKYLKNEWADAEPIKLSEKYVQVFYICSVFGVMACIRFVVEMLLDFINRRRSVTPVQQLQ